MNKVKMVMLFLIAKFLLTSTVSLGQCNVSTLNISTGPSSTQFGQMWRVVGANQNLLNLITQPLTFPMPAVPSAPTLGQGAAVGNYISFSSNGLFSSPAIPGNIVQSYNMTFDRTFRVCSSDSFTINLTTITDGALAQIQIDGVALSTLIPNTSFVAQPSSAANWTTPLVIQPFNLPLTSGTHTITMTVNDWAAPNVNPSNFIGISVNATITSISNQTSLLSDDPACTCAPIDTICSETCFWKLTGNTIANSNNIFGTKSNDHIRIISNSNQRGLISNTGNFGWGTTSPTATFHNNGTVRLENLTNDNTLNRILVQDAPGNVSWRDASTLSNTFTADNGITIDNNIIQLGAACEQQNNPFQNNRELLMNDQNLYFNSAERGMMYLGPNSCNQLDARLTISALSLPNAVNDFSTPAPSTSGLRFEALNNTMPPILNETRGVLSLDRDGDVIWVRDNTGTSTGISNSCSIINAIPKTVNANGSLACSRIYDNGTSVSIGGANGIVGSSFQYSPNILQGSLGGSLIQAASPSGLVMLDVHGVTRSTIFLAPSDSNYKMNFKKITNASEIIRRLQAKTFDWNEKAKREINADNGRHIGYIAQELENVVPEIVIKDENNHYAVNYTELIPVVTESQKELLQQFDELKKQNAKLEDDIKTLKAQNALILEAIGNAKNINQESLTKNSSFKVFPNPASEKIYIEHNIGFSYNTASIVLRDNSGKTIKVAIIDCESPCTSPIEIPSNFSNGNLICSLEVDGKVLFAETIIINANNR